MSKKVRITLLPLAAFLFLGFSIAANAGNPWLADKQQKAFTPAVFTDNGQAIVCTAVNRSDREILVTTGMYDDQGALDADGYEYPVLPGAVNIITGNGPGYRYCVTSWVGQAGDFVTAICSTAATVPYTSGCLNGK